MQSCCGELHRMLNKNGSDAENSRVESVEEIHTSLGNHFYSVYLTDCNLLLCCRG
jgi:hypothetical protein